MADLAAHLVDNVIPRVPVRQWVLTLPFRIRYLVAFDRELCRAVRAVFLRTVLSWYRSAGRKRGIPDGRSGTVALTQRFGSSVNLNPHFHALVLDGLYTDTGPSKRPPFRPATAPTDSDVEELLQKIANRIFALLRKRGLIDDQGYVGSHQFEEDSPVLAACSAAAVQGRVALGERSGDQVERPGRDSALCTTKLPEVALCARFQGFSLHGAVRIPARERNRLERLCRYVARPAIASERLSQTEDGKIHYEFRRPFSDGSTEVVFDPLVFLEKLAVLIPPPRQSVDKVLFAEDKSFRFRSRSRNGLEFVDSCAFRRRRAGPKGLSSAKSDFVNGLLEPIFSSTRASSLQMPL